MFVYQGHFVAFEWQSPHAFMKRRRVCGESHDGSFVAAGLAWLRPYGTIWITTNNTPKATAQRRNQRRRLPEPLFP